MSVTSSLSEANLNDVPVARIVRILLIDDHRSICRATAEHLERMASEFTDKPVSVDKAFTLAEGIDKVSSQDVPNLIFLDLNLEGESDGIETLERFQKANSHNIPVAIFTGMSLKAVNSLTILRKCLTLGVKGILLKSVDTDKMFIGLTRILDGDIWMPDQVLVALATTPPTPAGCSDRLGLSPREWDVARAMARGLQNKQIAQELGKSPQYIAQVTKQIYHKLGVRNRTQAALVINEGQRD